MVQQARGHRHRGMPTEPIAAPFTHHKTPKPSSHVLQIQVSNKTCSSFHLHI